MLLGHGHNPATVKWTMKDKLLFAAVVQLDREVCPDCGTPLWWGHSAHAAVAFELEWHVCYACQEKAELTKNIDTKPGEWATVTVVPDEDYGEPLPSRREGYAQRATPVYDTGGTHKDDDPDFYDGGIG